ncbi:MAG: hypothetical protein WCZ66_09605 [Sphingomonadaceae bacterium]
MRKPLPPLLLVVLIAPVLAGCVARTAIKAVTVPVRAAGTVAETAWDATTTSQEEADRNRGREMRKAEERAEKARKEQEKADRASQLDQPVSY